MKKFQRGDWVIFYPERVSDKKFSPSQVGVFLYQCTHCPHLAWVNFAAFSTLVRVSNLKFF